MAKNWIKIGVVGKPYGLRGAFYVSGRTEVLQTEISEVSVGNDASSGLKSKVKEQKIHKSRSVFILTELVDRTAMEKYVGKPIWALSAEAKIAVNEKSEYRWKDLIGKQVIDTESQPFGIIRDVTNHGASDIVEIENEKHEFLDIAFISAYFDMSFTSKDSEIRLVVPRGNFEDLWQESSESSNKPI